MGIKDVTTRQTRTIHGLDDKRRNHGFAAIVLDNRDLNSELPQLSQTYRRAVSLPKDEQPRVFTGANVIPESIWLPVIPPPTP